MIPSLVIRHLMWNRNVQFRAETQHNHKWYDCEHGCEISIIVFTNLVLNWICSKDNNLYLFSAFVRLNQTRELPGMSCIFELSCRVLSSNTGQTNKHQFNSLFFHPLFYLSISPFFLCTLSPGVRWVLQDITIELCLGLFLYFISVNIPFFPQCTVKIQQRCNFRKVFY